MKLFTALVFLLTACTAAAQQKPPHYAGSKTISPTARLVFLKRDKKSHYYYQPRLIVNGKTYVIPEFDYGSGTDIQISPNKRYIVMHYIREGDAEHGVPEKYQCVIVGVKEHRILQEMETECDGNWNKKNQWVTWEGKIAFTPSAD